MVGSGQLMAIIGCASIAAIVAWVTWRALHDPATYDAGLAYHAGQLAWSSGHPERIGSWDGSPLLAALMAVAGRRLSDRAVAEVVVILSITFWVGAAAMVINRLRPVLRPPQWWFAAIALFSFGPLMSTVWVKQFNAISLVLAIAGFHFVRRGAVNRGALAIGVSVALKPLLIMLPLVMLARRETRRAGGLACLWVAALTVASLALLAARGHSLGLLNPLHSLSTFHNRSRPAFLTCVPWNFSPAALMCRMLGYWPATLDAVQPRASLTDVYSHQTLQLAATLAAVAVLGLWVAASLRGARARSWEVFAFACALSTMLSPLSWSHYQLMLAPLFVLLWFRFTTEGAGLGSWSALVVSFVLASLSWTPYGSVFDALATVTGGGSVPTPDVVDVFAQFAQYLLVLTGIWWYGQRPIAQRGAERPPAEGRTLAA